MRAADVALVLLAAGRSERFGDADKLAADLRGKPLALHVVDALAGLPFRARIAVVAGTGIDFASHGFREVRNDDPAAGQARSLRLGVAAASAGAVLVVLADMPLVSAALVNRLLDAADGADAVVAASDGTRPSPPALFGVAHFEALMAREGDAGARDLIGGGRHLLAAAGELRDVDRPEDLARLRLG